jgi:hypothetical protein
VVIVQSDNFDGTPLAWEYDNPNTPTSWNPTAVQWKIDALPATALDWPGVAPYHSSPTSMNFNNDVDYDSGMLAYGSVTSPALNIGNLVNPKLRFWCMFETESGDLDYDQRFVEVSNDGFNTNKLACQATISGSVNISNCPWLAMWHQHEVALDPAWGVVQVRFRFYSVDDLFNCWIGWYIDDYEIVCDSVTPPPPGNPPDASMLATANGNGGGSPPPPPPPPAGGSGSPSPGSSAAKGAPHHRMCGGSAGATTPMLPLILMAALSAFALGSRRR